MRTRQHTKGMGDSVSATAVSLRLCLGLHVGSASVDALGRVVRHGADQVLLQQVLQGAASQGAVDLQALGDGRRGDQLHLARAPHQA